MKKRSKHNTTGTADEVPQIPFLRAVRIGNYKLWRSKYNIGSGADKTSIDCLHVSNLDGSWMVRIPSTSSMYGCIMNGFATSDDHIRESFLGMILTNMHNICNINSEALHDAFFFLQEMMTFPYLLLSEKEMVKRIEEGLKERGMDKKAIKEHTAKLVDWRKQLYELVERKRARLIEDYERHQALQKEYERVSEEEDLRHDDLAEQAAEILSNEEQ